MGKGLLILGAKGAQDDDPFADDADSDSESPEESSAESDISKEERRAARDVRDAIKTGDDEDLALALRAFLDLCS